MITVFLFLKQSFLSSLNLFLLIRLFHTRVSPKTTNALKIKYHGVQLVRALTHFCLNSGVLCDYVKVLCFIKILMISEYFFTFCLNSVNLHLQHF